MTWSLRTSSSLLLVYLLLSLSLPRVWWHQHTLFLFSFQLCRVILRYDGSVIYCSFQNSKELDFTTYDFHWDPLTSHGCFHQKSPGSQVGEAPQTSARFTRRLRGFGGWGRRRREEGGEGRREEKGGGGEVPAGEGAAGSVSLKSDGAASPVVATPRRTRNSHRLSSNDPEAEARTSRSWDIFSSHCVTELWRTALLDTQRSLKLCQEHMLLQSKHGYKTGSHHSPPAVCGSRSQRDSHFVKCYTRGGGERCLFDWRTGLK